ncbi:MAG TPA: hypothetical protein GYA07_10035 [Verrucomicrobia bacterium]|nr:hypothetical protein [Verrucomicrobiota bacterium]HOP97162.1 hypothetical protein [Verrucomicrobiota bacterium]HPU56905.1 hypothetical protein [Verrucomicrobiota bacterium]
MSLADNKGRLAALARELSLQWNTTREYWKDAKSLEFQRDYLEELFIDIDRTITVIEKLDELLKKVKSDCE